MTDCQLMGLRDIERRIRERSAMERKESELLIVDLRKMLENARALKERLRDIEKQFGKEIGKDQEGYKQLVEVRQALGLPEEMGVWEWQDRAKGISKSKFYENFGLEILELSRKQLQETGGIMALSELLLLIQRNRPGGSPPISDVKEALKRLAKEELIPPQRTLPNGVMLVEFVPVEFSPDHEKVLSLAALTASITLDNLIRKTGWSLDRASRLLDELQNADVAIVDESYEEGKRYYFPGLG